MWTISWAKKILKLYKAMTYFEKQKHLEPLMSKSFKEFARQLYKQVAENNSAERSVVESSVGFFDGISMRSQLKFSEDGSMDGSEISNAHSALLANHKTLETIDELPSAH